MDSNPSNGISSTFTRVGPSNALIPVDNPDFKSVATKVQQEANRVSQGVKDLGVELASKAASIAAAAMGVDYTSLLPGNINQLVENAKRSLLGTPNKIKESPLVNALVYTIAATPLFASDKKERAAWTLHMLAIAKNESNFNTLLIGKNKAGVPTAYGLLQHVRSNWNTNIGRWPQSSIHKEFVDHKVYQQLGKLWNVSPAAIVAPYPDWGGKTAAMEVYQFVPALAQMRNLKMRLNADFVFLEDGWQPNKPELAESVRWKQMKHMYGKVLKNYFAGRQAILALIHTQGGSWWQNSNPLEYPDRPKKDVVIMNAMLNDGTVMEAIRAAVRAQPYTLGSVIPAKPEEKITSTVPPLLAVTTAGASAVPKWKVSTQFHAVDKLHSDPHNGIDIVFDKPGAIHKAPVKSPAPGKVLESGWDSKYGSGNFVRILHDNGAITGYAHLDSIAVGKRKTVDKGTIIGYVGNTGNSHGPHLHLTLRPGVGKDTINPKVHFPKYGMNIDDIFT